MVDWAFAVVEVGEGGEGDAMVMDHDEPPEAWPACSGWPSWPSFVGPWSTVAMKGALPLQHKTLWRVPMRDTTAAREGAVPGLWWAWASLVGLGPGGL